MLFIIKYRRHPYANSMLMMFTHSATTDDSWEACRASYHLAREIQQLGHKAILLPAQHFRAYLRRQKNETMH